ncbi:hypothetical protein F8M41_019711 [Gigaspora margarita]|uniref:Uncharacterized protein n=1 Tax=Gigaspora margarita TaxID=4874 RepID=A0A8H4EK72_GIGMA|nr:hypothetical protein F8M41_019711 [Gigaspora margarita]
MQLIILYLKVIRSRLTPSADICSFEALYQNCQLNKGYELNDELAVKVALIQKLPNACLSKDDESMGNSNDPRITG